ncbi:MAG: beta-ketoacyl synthase chain length factor [Desulfarculaceae bacterium]|nr:beta-ketoacyl synthase chain length factor [Desulfarculaceae bacterium]
MKVIGKSFIDNPAGLKIKGARRADKFAKMAVKACLDIPIKNPRPDSDTETGVIVATRFGPHATTFKFLDGMLDHSDTRGSPTTFSHSVHNAAASYITTLLGIQGPAATLTCFDDPLGRALELAEDWLVLNHVDQVYVCYVEERSAPFDGIQEGCGALPFYGTGGTSEGAAAVLLTRDGNTPIPDTAEAPFWAIDAIGKKGR